MDPELEFYVEEIEKTIGKNMERILKDEMTEEQGRFAVEEMDELEKSLSNLRDRTEKSRLRKEEKEERLLNIAKNELKAKRHRIFLKNACFKENSPPAQVHPPEHSQVATAHTKLPRLQMEKFYGDIYKFDEFWQLFNINVHSRTDIPPVEKFNYLTTYLDGKAKNCISGIMITGENYETAVSCLRERYGDVQLVIDRHYKDLTEMPMAKNFGSSMRDTIEAVEKHLRCLENMGEDINQRIFTTIITSKFPPTLIFEVEKNQKAGDMLNTTELIEQLKSLIRAREKVYAYNSKFTPKESSSSNTNKFTTEALMTGENNVTKRCVFCELEHWSDECPKFTTLEERKVAIKGRCFRCLRKSHTYRECRLRKICVHCQDYRHHRSLCPKLFSGHTTEDRRTSKEGRSSTETTMMAVSEKVCMQTFTTTVCNPSESKTEQTRGIFDSGSQRSYIAESLRKRLNLEKRSKQVLSVFVFGNTQPVQITTYLVDVVVKLRSGGERKISVNVVPSIIGKLNSNGNLSQISLPDGFKLADSNKNQQIELLIGNDYYYDFILDERREVQPHLYLVNSRLGWILTGRYQGGMGGANNETMTFTTATFTESHFTTLNMISWVDPDCLPFEGKEPSALKCLWDLDTIGIKENPGEIEDDLAVQSFNDSIKMVDNRYVVSWPWKIFPPPDLSSNFGLAYGRLKSLLKRIKDQNVFADYNKIFLDQLEKGVIEKVENPFNKTPEHEAIHYLPHHAVITPEKSTKVRVVFDGSAKEKKRNKSLNECMYRGRVLLEDLTGILLRLRMHKFVVTADIEKAFLQIGLHNQDKDVTRFLWLKDLTRPPTMDNVEVFRFCRVAFGVISSPFLLNAVVKHHLVEVIKEKKHSVEAKVAEKMSKNIYVDNVVVGCDNEKEAMDLHAIGCQIFQRANMNLRCWISNVPALRQEVNDATESTKILGVNWNTAKDVFVVKSKTVGEREKITKKEVVRVVSSHFDPLGLFNPIIIQAKVFIQELWKNQLGWDDLIDSEAQQKWERIKSLLQEIPNQEIERFVGRPANGEAEIHCFTDASKTAYACALYLRFHEGTQVVSRLLFSKARVAPKDVTIPRLELMGVLIGIRSLEFVSKSLDIEITKRYVWTDSKCVLHWLRSGKVLPLFIENRLNEVKRAKNVTFKYVPSEHNPADWATKGRTVGQLDDFWWEGPRWLKQEELSWPSADDIAQFDNEDIQFATGEGESGESGLATVGNEQREDYREPFGLCAQKFSVLRILLMKTAYCNRFVMNLKRKWKKESSSPYVGNLTAEELKKATIIWCRHVQKKHFKKFLEEIKEGKPCALQLGLWIDEEGVIRCRGRVISEELSFAENFPILLPKRDHLTELVIKRFHVNLAHAGVAHTLAEIRKEFWILQGRSEVRRVIKRCVVCRFWAGGPFNLPKMPPLPTARISRSVPFMHTGVDYLGPLYVKEEPRKVWVCLFTCLVTRAVHLEVVTALSAEEFLMALRRFVARRGAVTHILSDNASHFTFMSRLVEEFLAETRINWQFVTELAPWEGGVYERLVSMVKGSLRRTIGRQKKLTYAQLMTIITEIEGILNSRPLTYVGDDVESNSILTPAHFLNVRSCTLGNQQEESQSYQEEEEPKSTRAKLLAVWSKGQSYLNDFWNVWQTEYLASLRERRDSGMRQGRIRAESSPRVGAVVLVGDRTQRGTWRVARIVETLRSKDGEIRKARVMIPNRKVLTRSIAQLYPLELEQE